MRQETGWNRTRNEGVIFSPSAVVIERTRVRSQGEIQNIWCEGCLGRLGEDDHYRTSITRWKDGDFRSEGFYTLTILTHTTAECLNKAVTKHYPEQG